MKIQWLFWLMLVLGSKNVCAQCSKEDGSGPGVPSTLHGKLTYHDDLRTWHALKPDQNVCAWESIEVVSTKLNWNQVHRFRGCGVTITGNLFTPITGVRAGLKGSHFSRFRMPPPSTGQSIRILVI